MAERDGDPGPEQPTWRHRYTGRSGLGFGGGLSFRFFLYPFQVLL